MCLLPELAGRALPAARATGDVGLSTGLCGRPRASPRQNNGGCGTRRGRPGGHGRRQSAGRGRRCVDAAGGRGGRGVGRPGGEGVQRRGEEVQRGRAVGGRGMLGGEGGIGAGRPGPGLSQGASGLGRVPSCPVTFPAIPGAGVLVACRGVHLCTAPRRVTAAARIQAHAWGTGEAALRDATSRGAERAFTLFPARMRALTQQSQSRRFFPHPPLPPPGVATSREHVGWEPLKDPPLPGCHQQTRAWTEVSTRGSRWKGVGDVTDRAEGGRASGGRLGPRAATRHQHRRGPARAVPPPATNSPNVSLLVLSPSQDNVSLAGHQETCLHSGHSGTQLLCTGEKRE